MLAILKSLPKVNHYGKRIVNGDERFFAPEFAGEGGVVNTVDHDAQHHE